MIWLCSDWQPEWPAIEAVAVWATAVVGVGAIAATVYVGTQAASISRAVTKATEAKESRAAKTLAIPFAMEFASAALCVVKARQALQDKGAAEVDRFDNAVFFIDRLDLSTTRDHLKYLELFPLELGQIVAAGYSQASMLRAMVMGAGTPVRIRDGTAKPGAADALLANVTNKEGSIVAAYKALCTYAGIPMEDPNEVVRLRSSE